MVKITAFTYNEPSVHWFQLCRLYNIARVKLLSGATLCPAVGRELTHTRLHSKGPTLNWKSIVIPAHCRADCNTNFLLLLFFLVLSVYSLLCLHLVCLKCIQSIMFTFSLSVYSVIFLQNNPGSLQCLVYLYSASFRVFFLDVPPPPFVCVCVCVCVCVVVVTVVVVMTFYCRWFYM